MPNDRTTKKELLSELAAARRKAARLERTCRTLQSGAMLERLFSNTHLLIAYLDRNFNFLRVNQSYAAADDRTADYFVGKNHFDLYPDKENEAIFRRVLRTGKTYYAENKAFQYAHAPERGTSYWNWSLETVPDDQGGTNGLLLLLVNQTQCRIMQMGQQAEQDRRRRKLEAGWQVDYSLNFLPEHGENQIVAAITGPVELLLGCRPEEFLSDRTLWMSLVLPEDRPTVMQSIEEAVRTGSAGKAVYRVVPRGQQRHIWIEDTFVPRYAADGRLMGFDGTIRDATREMDALHDLAIFRSLVDHASDAIYIIEPMTGQFLDFNGRACESLGYSRSELLHMRIRDVQTHTMDLAAWQAMVASLDEKGSARAEGRHRRKDGTDFHVEVLAKRITVDGKVYTIASARDITLRRYIEESLEKSREQYRTLVNTVDEVIYQFDRDASLPLGRPVFVSVQAEQMIGYTPGELIDDPGLWTSLVHPDDREQVLLGTRAMCSSGKPGTRVYRLRHRSGHAIWIEDRAVPHYDRSGKAIGVYGAARDITDRKRTETALRESEMRYRSLIDAANDAILVADIETGRIVEASRKAEELFQRPMSRLIGMHQTELHPREEGEKYRQTFAASVGQKQGMTAGNIFIENARGEHVPVEISVNQFESSGRKMIIGIFRDITERKRNQDALRNAFDEAEKFRLMVEYADQGVGTMDLEGNLLYANAALLRMLDIPSLQEFREHSLVDFYEPGEYELIRGTTLATVLEQGSWTGELTLCPLSGSRIPTIHNVYLVRDGQGRAVAFSNIVTDISERKRHEEELQRARDFAENLIRTANVSIVVLNNAGEVVQVNETALALTGFTREELIGQPWFERVIPPSSYAEVWEKFVWLQRSNQYTNRTTNPVLTRTGEERIISWQYSMLATEYGMVTVSFGMDITDQQRAEERLRKSEEQLRSAQKVARIGSWELELGQNKLSWSDEIFRIFEIDPARFAASYEAFLSAVHPEDRELVNEAYTRSVRERTPYTIEHRLLLPGGRIKFVREIGSTSYDESGMAVRSLGTVQDITEQRLAQESLRESRERLNFLISNSPAIIYTCKASGDYGATYISPNISQFLGYQSGDFLKDPHFWELHIHPEDRDRVFAGLASLYKRNVHSHEYRFRHKDGTWRWMHDDLKLVRNASGHPVEIIGSWSDITDRKMAEERLRESEERYRSITNAMPDLVYRLGVDGSVTYVSPSVTSVLGFTPPEAIGRHFMSFVHPDDALRAREANERHRTGLPVRNMELRLQTKGGGTIYASVNSIPIVQNGTVVEVQGVAQDITERKRNEALVLSSLHQKETLLREVHHRVKNNLQIIASLLYLQSEGIRDHEALSLFQESRDRIKSMAIVHEKLYRTDDIANIDLGSYLESLTTYLFHSYVADARGLKLELFADSIMLGIDVAVPCGLIVNELVSNSLKHAFTGQTSGIVRLTASLIGANTVRLVVADDGKGYTDADITRTQTLGMRLVDNLVKQLRGTLEIEAGKGTSIVLVFPVEPKKGG